MQFIDLKTQYALIFISCLAGLIACGSDEEELAPTVTSKSAEWSVLVDGHELTGDILEFSENESD